MQQMYNFYLKTSHGANRHRRCKHIFATLIKPLRTNGNRKPYNLRAFVTMLNKDQLLQQINATMGKTKVLELTAILQHKNFKLRDLIELTFYDNKKIAFRAAWLLENLFLQRPDAYITDLEYLVSSFPYINHGSCKRHYAKIAMHITAPQASPSIKQQLFEIDMEPVINQCFDWVIDPKVLVAVKSFATEALFNLRHRYPWIAEELSAQLEYLMRDGSPAIQSKGEKLLAYLHPLA